MSFFAQVFVMMPEVEQKFSDALNKKRSSQNGRKVVAGSRGDTVNSRMIFAVTEKFLNP